MSQNYILTDFQQRTADRIFEIFRSGQRRVLLADEVGLGKTIVAREGLVSGMRQSCMMTISR